MKDKFRGLVRELRRRAPPLLPVRVYLRDADPEYLGTTQLVRVDGKPSHFIIVLHRMPGWSYLRTFLLHEWAHAVAWHEGHDTVHDHGPEWGIAYARLYQEFVDP